MLTPSVYNIDAWEDTEVLTITRAGFLELSYHVPALSEVVKSMDEKHAIATQKRLTASISLSAEKRYADLSSRYPELLKRFPQHQIASYLGITKETLSRVRHRIQWMKAGNGIIHDETMNPDSQTGSPYMHGFQFWINLPASVKKDDPAYLAVDAGRFRKCS